MGNGKGMREIKRKGKKSWKGKCEEKVGKSGKERREAI